MTILFIVLLFSVVVSLSSVRRSSQQSLHMCGKLWSDDLLISEASINCYDAILGNMKSFEEHCQTLDF